MSVFNRVKKTTVGQIRKLIREMLMIPDYVKYLQKYELQEKVIEAQFGDALTLLIKEPIMQSTFPSHYNMHNAEMIVHLFEKGLVSIDKGTNVGDDILVAANEDGDELVWDEDNGVWWTESDDKVEFDRVLSRGVSKTPTAPVEKTCPDCGGTGEWQGLFRMNKCSTCNGTGKVTS